MEDLEIVERVGIKRSKKTELDIYTPSDPIKATHKPHSSNMSNNFSEQRNDSPCPDKKQGVTAFMAVLKAENSCRSSKKSSTKKLVRVLLDTGSDGDLLFHEKGTTKQFPYLTRQVPKSNSKRVKIQPDVVEYGKGSIEKPILDLILGTQTMDELGIILDFKTK
jgi:hypothetical protein